MGGKKKEATFYQRIASAVATTSEKKESWICNTKVMEYEKDAHKYVEYVW